MARLVTIGFITQRFGKVGNELAVPEGLRSSAMIGKRGGFTIYANDSTVLLMQTEAFHTNIKAGILVETTGARGKRSFRLDGEHDYYHTGKGCLIICDLGKDRKENIRISASTKPGWEISGIMPR